MEAKKQGCERNDEIKEAGLPREFSVPLIQSNTTLVFTTADFTHSH